MSVVIEEKWQAALKEIEQLKARLEIQAKSLKDAEAELKARGEILDMIQASCGVRWWSGAVDWRLRLRDFAEDSEQHTLCHEDWENERALGVTLYADANFFTSYYDDAADMWGMADDDLPMYHVMVQSDPPHRTCIHAMHLAVWAQALASACMPLQIRGRSDSE